MRKREPGRERTRDDGQPRGGEIVHAAATALAQGFEDNDEIGMFFPKQATE